MTNQNSIRINNGKIEAHLELLFKKDGDSYISYSPALNLSGCGDTIEEAAQSFSIVLGEYFKFTLQNGTLEQDLIRHNWTKEKKRAKEVFEAPSYWLIIASNRDAQEFAKGEYLKRNKRLTITC